MYDCETLADWNLYKAIDFIGAIQKLRNATFGNFWHPSPPYVTKRNILILPPPPVLRNESWSYLPLSHEI